MSHRLSLPLCVAAYVILMCIASTAQISDTRRCSAIDIVFIIDNSGSIGLANWNSMLQFVTDIVTSFTLGDRGLRAGLVSFGNFAYVSLLLKNSPSSPANFSSAIATAQYRGEAANVSGALRVTCNTLFTPDYGDRPNAPNFAVVVMDGQSNRDTQLVVKEATNCRQKGVTAFAIGVGPATSDWTDELAAIAFNQSFLFQLNTFSNLQLISQSLVPMLCQAVIGTCHLASNVVLVIDQSVSVTEDDWSQVMGSISFLIQAICVVPRLSLLGVVFAGPSATGPLLPLLPLDNSTWPLIQQTLAAARASGFNLVTDRPNIAAGLSLARDALAAVTNGAQRSIVVITKSSSLNAAQTIQEAVTCRLAGIFMAVVAGGYWNDPNELAAIVSEPYQRNFYQLPALSSLLSIISRISLDLCNDYSYCPISASASSASASSSAAASTSLSPAAASPSAPCYCQAGWADTQCSRVCSGTVDLAIVLDASTVIKPSDFFTAQQFVKSLVASLPISQVGGIRVSVVTYGNYATVRFGLADYGNAREVATTTSFMQDGGSKRTWLALDTLRNNVFVNSSNAIRLAVILTDGRSPNRTLTFQSAVTNKKSGIGQIAVGVSSRGPITNDNDLLELQTIASLSNQSTLLLANNFSSLFPLVDTLTQLICKAASVNACLSKPCLNDATCVRRPFGYTCKCSNMTSGKLCERNCTGVLDLVLILDVSNSIRSGRFSILQQVAKVIVASYDVRPEATRVGLVTFSTRAKVEFDLDIYTTVEVVLNAIDQVAYRGGSTNIADALRLARDDVLLSRDGGGRQGVDKHIILITHGSSTIEASQTGVEAGASRQAGIRITVLAPELDDTNSELGAIASWPLSVHLLTVTSYSLLPSLVSPAIAATCNDVNPCQSSPCVNGATCVASYKSFTCRCPSSSFGGLYCERSCRPRQVTVVAHTSEMTSEGVCYTQNYITRYITLGLDIDAGQSHFTSIHYSGSQVSVDIRAGQYNTTASLLDAVAFTCKDPDDVLGDPLWALGPAVLWTPYNTGNVVVMMWEFPFPYRLDDVTDLVTAGPGVDTLLVIVLLGDNCDSSYNTDPAFNTAYMRVFCAQYYANLTSLSYDVMTTICM